MEGNPNNKTYRQEVNAKRSFERKLKRHYIYSTFEVPLLSQMCFCFFTRWLFADLGLEGLSIKVLFAHLNSRVNSGAELQLR